MLKTKLKKNFCATYNGKHRVMGHRRKDGHALVRFVNIGSGGWAWVEESSLKIGWLKR